MAKKPLPPSTAVTSVSAENADNQLEAMKKLKTTQTSSTLEKYNKRARELIALSNNLRDLGGHFDLQIPGIAVVGNQSAGKSSLMEAIARIPLPRSDGTCTRCPMECRLVENDGPWKCEVMLRVEVDKEGTRLARPVELKFGEPILDIGKVEDRLRRAQKAILNPSIDNSLILDAADLDGFENELAFTENIVCIRITGKDVGNLTLVDLPGIISSTERKEDEKYIDLVRNMALKSIKPDNIIIVECLTCKDDIDNQSVHTLAKQCDPDGTRTVGVLTKPDTIETGCHESWLKMLRGDSHHLYHGYFMVKNPNKADLEASIDFGTAREKEMAFFNNTSPWSDGATRDRLGVQNLKTFLSDLLVAVMDRGLPEIINRVKTDLARIESSLFSLPSPVTHKQSEIFRVINEFTSEVKEHAHKLSEPLTKERNVFQILNLKVKMTVPILICGEENPGKYYGSIWRDDESVDINGSNQYAMKDLKQLIEESKGRDFAGMPPKAAIHTIIRKSVACWDEPMTECLDQITETLSTQMQSIAEDYGRFPSLQKHLIFSTEKFLTETKKSASDFLDRLLEMEGLMVTLNDHYMTHTQQIFEKKLKAVFSKKKVKSQESLRIALAHLAEAGFSGLSEKALIEKLGELNDESFAEPIFVFSLAKSYWKVAYKRFVDNVYTAILSELVFKYTDQLDQYLLKSITADEDNLIREDPSIVAKRSELQNQHDRILSVQKQLVESGFL